MRVLFVTGSFPPDVCGVGDYTGCLVAALKERGVDTCVLTGQDWSPMGVPKLIERVGSYKADIVHIQYPTRGFGYQPGPQLLSMLRPTVVTIHEVSQAHILRRLSLYGFSLRSQRVIFTTEFEKDHATRWCPWIAQKATVIAIGTNVAVSVKPVSERLDIVGYFGLIRPMKGLEQILEAAAELRDQAPDMRVRIIGKVTPGMESYYEELRAKGQGVPVEWCIGVDDSMLADLIGSCKFAYLPFPDGASERRASLIAFMEAGACIVTTKGDQTPRFMEDAMQFSNNPREAVGVIKALKGNPELVASFGDRASLASQRFSWSHIAEDHCNLYREIVGD
jgi:glycosyltransferase involved in cell wall biosynthesis